MNTRYLLHVAQDLNENPLTRIAAYQLYMGKTIGQTIAHLMSTYNLTIEKARQIIGVE